MYECIARCSLEKLSACEPLEISIAFLFATISVLALVVLSISIFDYFVGR